MDGAFYMATVVLKLEAWHWRALQALCVAAVALESGQVCDHRKHSVQNTHLEPVVALS